MEKINRAVITGASSGIGAAFARELASRGTSLIIAARRTENLDRLAAELSQKYNVHVEVLTLDLTHPEAAQILLDACTRTDQPIDLIINNAGVGPYRNFLNTALKEHISTLQLNLVSLTAITHLFARHMLGQGSQGFILNVASVASYQSMPKFAVYCSSKSYVRIFSEIFAHEMRKTNVSVSCLCPGGTATDFLDSNNQKITGAGSHFLMSAEAVARIGIDGVLKRKRVIIPGMVNKMICLISKMLPSRLNILLAESSMKMAVGELDKTKV